MTVYLECPCCGDDGAVGDERDEFFDGQPLLCGCAGCVSVDGEEDVHISNGDEPCPPAALCNRQTPAPALKDQT